MSTDCCGQLLRPGSLVLQGDIQNLGQLLCIEVADKESLVRADLLVEGHTQEAGHSKRQIGKC